MQGLPAGKLSPTSVRNRCLFLDVQNSSSALEREQNVRVLRKGLRGEGMQGPFYSTRPRFVAFDLTTRSSVRRRKSILTAKQESLLTIAGRNVPRRIDRSMVGQLELCEYISSISSLA